MWIFWTVVILMILSVMILKGLWNLWMHQRLLHLFRYQMAKNDVEWNQEYAKKLNQCALTQQEIDDFQLCQVLQKCDYTYTNIGREYMYGRMIPLVKSVYVFHLTHYGSTTKQKLIDFDEQLMCSKLISNNMLVKYEDMEEYEELEVTIIARITSGNMVNAKKAFYDPLKDFMTLNRAMRRSIGGRTDGLYEIYADRDYRTIEILAIYQ